MKRAGTVLVGVLAIGFGCLAYSYVTLPDVRSLARSNPRTTAFMEIRDQEARDRAREPKRIHRWVNYNRISSDLKRAVLVAEDASFWDHDGVDYIELQKSIELDWARGQLTRGASTITQQLAKNLYLSPSKNPLRKLRELVIARRLEVELKKARILELYLNLIEWGDGIYGIEAAAREYFGTSAAALGPAESALLAGAIINPRLLNPHHPTPRLLRRQQIILGRMGRVDPPGEVAGGRLDAPEGRREASPENEHGERREDRRADPTETAPAAREPEDEHVQPEHEESRAEASSRVDERAPERLAALPFHIPAHVKILRSAQLDSVAAASA